MRLRSYTEICFALLIQPIMKTHKTKKLSIEEKRRIQVLESFRAACSSSPSKRALYCDDVTCIEILTDAADYVFAVYICTA